MKRKSAYAEILAEQQKRASATQDSQERTEKEVINGKTVIPQNTVKQPSKTQQRKKITFYLEEDQANRIDDLIEEFRQKTGMKINQQTLIRRIVEAADINSILP